ncbi:calcium ion-regulated exocytosis of neurotransmitter [Homalodisca vitripennis]|nr:calcium ion-regulated exocytosis of neurotransmitter [Homalodisca vitripennis]
MNLQQVVHGMTDLNILDIVITSYNSIEIDGDVTTFVHEDRLHPSVEITLHSLQGVCKEHKAEYFNFASAELVLCKKIFAQSVEKAMTSNPANIWKYVNRFKRNPTSVLAVTVDGQICLNQVVKIIKKQLFSYDGAAESIQSDNASPSPWAALRNSPEMRAYSSMPRHQDCEFITRTAFANRLNLTKTLDNNEPIEQIKPDEKVVENTIKSKDEEESNNCPSEDIVSQVESVEEKASDSASEENMVSVPVTDYESSQGSPVVDKRSLSESTSIDQSSIGSPVMDSESPLVTKRSVNDAVIEPLTGSVFRKVTLKKRRVDTRNLPPG